MPTIKKSAPLLLNALVILIVFTMALRTVAGLDRLFAFLLPPLMCGLTVLAYRHGHLPRELKMTYLFITLFFGWAALTALWSETPRYTLVRAMSGFGMTVLAVHCGYLWRTDSNKGAFSYLLALNVAAVLLSFISMAFSIPSNAWNGANGGRFMGYFVHPNTLSALLLFSSPSFIFPLFIDASHDGMKNRWKETLPLMLLLPANLYIVFCAYSRTTLIVFFLIGAALGFMLIRRRAVKLIYLASILAALLLLVASKASFLFLTRGYGTPLSNRAVQMSLSVNAARDGGLFGLGYGTSDSHISAPSYLIHSDGNIVRREKGNSILAVIEETGLTGLLLFALLFVPAAGSIFRCRRSGQHTILYPFLILIFLSLSVHAQFEAWWVGISSIQYFIFFTFLGIVLRESCDVDQANTLRA